MSCVVGERGPCGGELHRMSIISECTCGRPIQDFDFCHRHFSALNDDLTKLTCQRCGAVGFLTEVL